MNSRILIFALISLAFIVPVAFAASETGDIRASLFDARYNEASCRVDRLSAIVSAYETCTSQNFSKVDNDLRTLSSDISNIKSAADAGNRTELISLMQIYAKDTKSILEGINAAKSSLHDRNLTEREKVTVGNRSFTIINRTALNSIKDCINVAFDAATSDFAVCHSNATIAQGKAVSAWLSAWKDRWDVIIDNMSAKGLNTTGTSEVVSDVDEAIADMNNAVNSGNATLVIDTETSVKDEQLHLWARFNIARLDAYIANLTSLAQQYNQTGTLNDAQAYLNDASAMAVSGTPYAPGQFDKTWDDIKAAAIDISAVLRAVHAET